MMRKRHALVFAGGYRPEMFGIGRYVPHYVDALAEAGWTAEVLAPYPFYPAWKLDRSVPAESEESGGSVRVVRYAPYVPASQSPLTRGLHELSIGVQALRRVSGRVDRADVIVAATPPLLGAAAAVWLSRRGGRPSVVLAYDIVADLAQDAFHLTARAPTRLLRAVEAGLYRGADRVIALSDEMAARIRALSGLRDAIPVIRIWADDELFAIDHDDAAARFRECHGIGADQKIIGFAGNFGVKQRLPDIARAAQVLDGGFTTVFVGDGASREGLERLAAEGRGDVRVLPAQPVESLHAFLCACDVAVVVAWTRQPGSLFPSKVANILAAGAPVVAVTAPDTELAALVEREGIGEVCPSLEPRDVAAALRRTATHQGRAERRERCKAYARRHFDRRAATAAFLEQLEQTVAAHQRRRSGALGRG